MYSQDNYEKLKVTAETWVNASSHLTPVKSLEAISNVHLYQWTAAAACFKLSDEDVSPITLCVDSSHQKGVGRKGIYKYAVSLTLWADVKPPTHPHATLTPNGQYFILRIKSFFMLCNIHAVNFTILVYNLWLDFYNVAKGFLK